MNTEIIIQQILIEVAANDGNVSATARSLGLHQQTLDRILKGEAGMGIRTVTRILQARPEWWDLLGDNGNQPQTGPVAEA